MIGTRTRYPSLNSLALQEPMLSIVLLSRYDVQHRVVARPVTVWALEHVAQA